MKKIVLWVVLLSALASAHPADPNLLLAKYSLYGKEGIVSSPNVTTEKSGLGWIGTDQIFSGSGSTVTYGPLKVGGEFQAAGGTYYGSMDVLGDITSSGGKPIFGNAANGPDTVRYNGLISTYTGSPVLKSGQATVVNPSFPTYTVQPDVTRNCTLNPTGWTGVGCPISGQGAGTILPPGRYGDVVIASGAKGYFKGGNYEFASLTVYDTLVVDKAPKEMTRLMVKGDFSLVKTGVGAILTKQANDLGRVLIYVSGTNVSTQQGQTLMATLLAKNATVSVNPNMKVFGQIMAKAINLSNGFDGSTGAFVPFQPIGITYTGSDTLYEDNGTPALLTDNSRWISFPIVLQTPLNTSSTVQFRLSPGRVGSSVGMTTDFDTTLVGTWIRGTLNFAPNDTAPTALPKIWLRDDGAFEGVESLKLELWGATPKDSVGVDGADSLTGIGTWDLFLKSDDPDNHLPTGLALSSDTLYENRAQGTLVGVLSATDPDLGQNFSYELLSGKGFRISGDSLWADSTYDYEKDVRQIPLTIRVYDWQGTNPMYFGSARSYYDKNFVITLKNLNDNVPWATQDSARLSEGASVSLLTTGQASVLANDFDVDSLGLLRVASVLKNANHGVFTPNLALGTWVYTHDGSENFQDSVVLIIQDSLFRGQQWRDTTTLYFEIQKVNDNAPNQVVDLPLLTRLEDFADTVQIDMTGHYSDVDGDSIQYTLASTSAQAQGMMIGNLIKVWSKPDSNGTFKLVVKISDGLAAHDQWDTLIVQITPVNDAPFLVSQQGQSIEDQGLVQVNSWTQTHVKQVADEVNQSITLSLMSQSNTSLFVSGQEPALDSLGNLRYETLPDAFGVDTLYLRVKDNGGTANGGVDTAWLKYVLVVRPVNDAPSFVSGVDSLQYLEDTGSVAVAWATALSKGPFNESNQKLNFQISSSNPALLDTVWMDTLGVLHFVTGADAYGSTTLNLRLVDDGGIADGGVDSSVAVPLVLTLLPVNDPPRLDSLDFFVYENNADRRLLDSVVQGGISMLTSDVRYWLAREVDGETMTFLLQDTLIEVEASTGVLHLRSGVQLDFERQNLYRFRLGVTSGVDTVWADYDLHVLNIPESTQVIAQQVQNRSQNFDAAHNDTLWTNQADFVVRWSLDGRLVDRDYVVQTNAQTVLDTTWLNPTKDLAGSDPVVVRMNERIPVIRVADSTLKLYDGVYYTKDIQEVLNLKIERYDANLNLEILDTNLTQKWTEGRHHLKIQTTDLYGNQGELELDLVVDTTAPKVVIQNPRDSVVFQQIVIPVEWTLDGIQQDSLTEQSLKLGLDTIIRTVVDLAGNVGSDTVVVRFVLDEGSTKVKVLAELITGGEELREWVQQRTSMLGRDPLDDEVFSLTMLNSKGDQGLELAYGSDKKWVQAENNQGTAIDLPKIPTLGVDIHMILPFNGGLDALGNPREGLCPDGLPMWEQSLNRLDVEIFDHSGQFVDYHHVIQSPLLLTDMKWQDDQGQIALRFELLPQDGMMRDQTGRLLANGAYILRLGLETLSKPVNCNPVTRTQEMQKTIVHKVGYVRTE